MYYINDEVAQKFANKGDISKTIRQPMILQNGHGFNKGGAKEICPTITTGAFRENNFVVEQMVIGSTQANAYKGSLDGCCPTLTQAMGAGGGQIPMVTVPVCLNSKVDGKQLSLQDRIYDTSAISTAITTSFMPSIYDQRIRKLTPLECWRLMDYTDEDFHKAKAVTSNTQLYKQAGNGIVKQVLMAIFEEMIR